MRDHYFDFRKLRNESDIKTAKEKLKYYVLAQEEMLSTSVDNLRCNIFNSFKRSVLETGTRIITNALLNHLKSRLIK